MILAGLRSGGALADFYAAGFGGEDGEFQLALFFVSVLIQWLLLRNPVLEMALWLPVVFGGLGLLAAEIVCRVAVWHTVADWWLVVLCMPLYAGAAATILAAKIKYWGAD